MIDTTKALMLCPFCGSGATKSTRKTYGRFGYVSVCTVSCTGCGARVHCPDDSDENGWVTTENAASKAVAAWNRRAAYDAAPAPSDGLTGIWPDFIAPSKYEAPDPRWQDPGLPDFRLIWKLAREKGYAVGLHGSMKRDCDLIAAPWVTDAAPVADLIAHLRQGLNADEIEVKNAEPKPHGRQAFVLQIRDAYKKAIDISVVPPAPSDGIAAGMRRAADECKRLAESYTRSLEHYAEDDPQWAKIKWGAAAVTVAAENILAAIPPAPAGEGEG